MAILTAPEIKDLWVLFASHPSCRLPSSFMPIFCRLGHTIPFGGLTDDPTLVPTISQTQYAL